MEDDIRKIDPRRLEALRIAAGVGPVLILTHDNPDPDALASGKALWVLFQQAWGIASELVYTGLVGRTENQSMVTLLTPEWRQVEVLEDLDHYTCIALVDTQPDAGNNSLPASIIPGIVFDHHHPYQGALEAVQFVELHEDVGATVCLVVPFLEAAGIEPDAKLATAIFYAIQTDTRSLTRSDSPIDQRIYFDMLRRIDRGLLLKVEQARLPRDYFKSFVRGLQAARIIGGVVVSHLGSMHRPDFTAELADVLIRYQGARAVLCTGYHGATMYLSMRSSDSSLDAGSLIQEVIFARGRAGGHGMIAGGRIPLEGLAPEFVADEVEMRFLNAVNEKSNEAVQLL